MGILWVIIYLILTVGIAVTAVFDKHLETHLRKKIREFKTILAWTHFLDMNVGGTAVAITMICAGLIGSGILGVITSGGSASAVAKLAPNNAIMVRFIRL
jgi:hypothetical protein